MTPQDIESKVRKEWPAEKYEALCEKEFELELQVQYLKTPLGKQTSIDGSGEEMYEKSLRNAEFNLKLTRQNKDFIESIINAKAKKKKA